MDISKDIQEKPLSTSNWFTPTIFGKCLIKTNNLDRNPIKDTSWTLILEVSIFPHQTPLGSHVCDLPLIEEDTKYS